PKGATQIAFLLALDDHTRDRHRRSHQYGNDGDGNDQLYQRKAALIPQSSNAFKTHLSHFTLRNQREQSYYLIVTTPGETETGITCMVLLRTLGRMFTLVAPLAFAWKVIEYRTPSPEIPPEPGGRVAFAWILPVSSR